MASNLSTDGHRKYSQHQYHQQNFNEDSRIENHAEIQYDSEILANNYSSNKLVTESSYCTDAFSQKQPSHIPEILYHQEETYENPGSLNVGKKTFDCMDAKQVSKYGPGKRFLPLGDHLVCRLYDDFMTIPRIEKYNYEDSNISDKIGNYLKNGKNPLKYHNVTRTFMNLKNLLAVRGPIDLLKNNDEHNWNENFEKEFINQSMIGPCDYFGYLKEPHNTAYRIILNDGDNEDYITDKNRGMYYLNLLQENKRNGLPLIIGYKENNNAEYENASAPVIINNPESELLTRHLSKSEDEIFKFNLVYNTCNESNEKLENSSFRPNNFAKIDIFLQREAFPYNYASKIQVEWIPGSYEILQNLQEKQLSDNRPIVSSIRRFMKFDSSTHTKPLERGHLWNLPSLSLFPNPGIMLLPHPNITIKRVDGRKYDLSSFKAQLVKHDRAPFRVPSAKGDQYKIITYSYGKDYADKYILNTDGLFLEHHEFAQMITPLNRECRGFVVLARISNASTKSNLPTKTEIWKEELEFIGVEIPYGWTLVIQKDSLHGDSTLQGMYMMCMTADHNDMATANAVFLRTETTEGKLENVRIELSGDDTACSESHTCQIPKILQPMILDNTKSSVDSVNKVINESPLPTIMESGGMVLTRVIFNPLSQAYRRLNLPF